jgi:glycosyltransferase involved in cell wall biosynthesis
METRTYTSKIKKILIFSLVYYPRVIGGAEVAIKEITDRISSQDIEFDMITLRKHGSAFEKIGNVNVYRVGLPWFGTNAKSSNIFPLSKLLFPLFAFIKAIQLHRINKYDATWAMMASYAGFAAYLFKKIYKDVPFTLSLQEGDNFERREGVFGFFFKKIFARADFIQVISLFLKDWAIHMGAKCPIEIVPNAVDSELFSNRKIESELNMLKEKLGKKPGDVFLVTTSRLVMKNATGDVIDALHFLPSNVKFLILGTGYQEPELREKVKEKKLDDRVVFLGYIKHADMPQYLHVSDIFIRPALSEGFGNSYIEAMAAGIPVIATPVGGIVDFLTDGKTGLFCKVNSPQSIASTVLKFIEDKELVEKIVKTSFEMVQNKYEWSLIARDMKNKVFLTNI